MEAKLKYTMRDFERCAIASTVGGALVLSALTQFFSSTIITEIKLIEYFILIMTTLIQFYVPYLIF